MLNVSYIRVSSSEHDSKSNRLFLKQNIEFCSLGPGFLPTQYKEILSGKEKI